MPEISRRLLSSSLIFICAASAIGYWLSNHIQNAQPSHRRLSGWATVLESDSPLEPQAGPHRVELTFMTQEWHVGSPQTVQYKVAACGSGPFEGLLVLGGSARIDSAELISQRDTQIIAPTAATAYLEGENPVQLQLIRFRIVDFGGCPPNVSLKETEFEGVTYELRGRLKESLLRVTSMVLERSSIFSILTNHRRHQVDFRK
jgi:hypothetical protein